MLKYLMIIFFLIITSLFVLAHFNYLEYAKEECFNCDK